MFRSSLTALNSISWVDSIFIFQMFRMEEMAEIFRNGIFPLEAIFE